MSDYYADDVDTKEAGSQIKLHDVSLVSPGVFRIMLHEEKGIGTERFNLKPRRSY